MKTASINNSPYFGHSFRVSICLKNKNTFGETFVSPASNKKLYRDLNSKIVGWLNEDYNNQLREFLGVERKVNKTKPSNDIHKKLVKELKNFDKDYKEFGYTRSVYNGGRLAYIVTGVDVPIIENLKAAKFIGIAKADSKWYNGTAYSDYVKALTRLIKGNMLEYVQNNNVLLRSKNNKEMMLRAIFKENGVTKSGVPNYELDRFEFHENKTLPTLLQINNDFIRYKYNPSMNNEIKTTIKHHIDKMTKTKNNTKKAEKFFQY